MSRNCSVRISARGEIIHSPKTRSRWTMKRHFSSLNPSQQPVDLHLRDEFHSKIEVTTGAPLPKPDDEDPFFIDDNHLLDVGELIREYALLELPMQTFCRPDCKGLCPSCGADLNTGDCGCQLEEDDDRFDVLKSLLG